MKIHGLRIYPQSVTVEPGVGAPIFIHGRVSDVCTDFYYAFRPLESVWCDHVFAQDFCVTYDEQLKIQDPTPSLRNEYGSSLIAADLSSQLMLLRGEDFSSWAPSMHFCEGAFLPIFRPPPSFSLLKQLYWGRDFRLSSETWPATMRALLHMWDDIYWQLFTTDYSDIEVLIRTHVGDPKLKMYFVDLDREYPNPSNQELEPATIP